MLEDIPNFLALSINLFTGRMSNKEQLADAVRRGVDLVINLAPHQASNAPPNETEIVASLGMQYINIPAIWNTPTQDGLDRFMDDIDKKILVDCQANFRATACMARYRILRQGWNADDAMEGMHKIRDLEDDPIWKMFIEENLERSHEGL